MVVESWRPILTQEAFQIVSDEWGRFQLVTPQGNPTTLRQVESAASGGLRQLLSNGTPGASSGNRLGDNGPGAAKVAPRHATLAPRSFARSRTAQPSSPSLTGPLSVMRPGGCSQRRSTCCRAPAVDFRSATTTSSTSDSRASLGIDGGAAGAPLPSRSTSRPRDQSSGVTLSGDGSDQIELRRAGPQDWLLSPRRAARW